MLMLEATCRYPEDTPTPSPAFHQPTEVLNADGAISDQTDLRVLGETQNRTYTYTGSKSGIRGEIDDEQDAGKLWVEAQQVAGLTLNEADEGERHETLKTILAKSGIAQVLGQDELAELVAADGQWRCLR